MMLSRVSTEVVGGGYTTSGLGLMALTHSDYCAERLAEMQESLIAQFGLIVERAQQGGIEVPNVWEFGVQVKDDVIYAVEVKCGLVVRLGAL